jgi:hypothetical protein
MAIAYLQAVYRDPNVSIELRMDAAAKAMGHERRAPAAMVVKDMTLPLSDEDLDRESKSYPPPPALPPRIGPAP